MRKKIIGNVIEIISFIGSIVTISQVLIAETYSWKFIVLSGMIFCLFIVIIVFSCIQGNQLANLFSLILNMALNNKLHSLRELLMVIRDQRKFKIQNNLKIKKLELKYQISEFRENNSFLNVHYSLNFDFLKGLQKPFHFYFICEKGNLENTIAEIWTQNGTRKNVEFCPKLSTISGKTHDHSTEFSSLYEVTINISSDKNEIIKSLKIEYDIIDHINCNDSQYDFVIVPQNYGKNIDEVEINILSKNNLLRTPELWQINSEEDAICSEQLEILHSKNKCYIKKFKPKMKSIYFVQFSINH